MLKAYHMATGVEVQEGEELTNFRGESGFIFDGVTHPRKVNVKEPSDAPWARDGYVSREYYNSGFDLVIEDKETGYVWGDYAEGVSSE